jgi:hypothetical protein
MRRRALAAMAAYYVATGAWPILHMRSFEAITGPKRDKWLVKTVGTLAIANGCALAFGLRRERVSEETAALAVCSALAFSIVDIAFVLRGRIPAIYLADVPVELALAALIVGGG